MTQQQAETALASDAAPGAPPTRRCFPGPPPQCVSRLRFHLPLRGSAGFDANVPPASLFIPGHEARKTDGPNIVGPSWIVNTKCRGEPANNYTRLAIAFANPIVLPVPPRSGVTESFASSVAMIAARSFSACSHMPR